MNNLEILVISKFFYPQNTPRAFRTVELVKEFARRGHHVTLLTPENKEVHYRFAKKHGIAIKDLGPLKFKEIDITETGLVKFIKRACRRVGTQFFEYPDIEFLYRVKKALKGESGYDLMISIANPHPIHWGVAWARESDKIAKTWIADCGDPFMGQKMQSYNKPFYFSLFEKWFCKKADYISVPEEDAKDAYYPEFQKKLKVIPQGFNFNEVEVRENIFQESPPPTFAYAGSFYKINRDPRTFIDFLLNLNKEFKFIIYTNDKNFIRPYIDQANGMIEIRDYVPRNDLLLELSTMDFLVNFSNSQATSQIPSKLIDYYLTGRPVLSINPDYFDEEKINEFLSGDYTNKYTYENIARYQIENVADKFLKFV